jgi:hypothetical protein
MTEEQEPKTKTADRYRAGRQFERFIFHGVPEDKRAPNSVPRLDETNVTHIGMTIYDSKARTITYECFDGSKIIEGPKGRQVIEAPIQNKGQE